MNNNSNFRPKMGLFIDTAHELLLGVRIPWSIVETINNGANQTFKLGLQPTEFNGRVPIFRAETTTLRVPKNGVSPSTDNNQ